MELSAESLPQGGSGGGRLALWTQHAILAPHTATGHDHARMQVSASPGVTQLETRQLVCIAGATGRVSAEAAIHRYMVLHHALPAVLLACKGLFEAFFVFLRRPVYAEGAG